DAASPCAVLPSLGSREATSETRGLGPRLPSFVSSVTGPPAGVRLAEAVRHWKLAVVPRAGIGDAPFDEAAQAELLVQLARKQQTGIGGQRLLPGTRREGGDSTRSEPARCRATSSLLSNPRQV